MKGEVAVGLSRKDADQVSEVSNCNVGSQVLSYLFGPKPSRSSPLWLSPSLPFGPLSRHWSLRHRRPGSFSSRSPLPSSGGRVEAEAAPERQISGRWPAFDSFAKTVLSRIPSLNFEFRHVRSVFVTFSYTRPFLVVSCSGSDTWKTSWINFIAGSVASRLRAFIVCWYFDFIPSLWPNLCSKPHKVRRREICHT